MYIYSFSNKWKQAEDLFHAFVKAGCKVGAEDLDLVKYFRLREAWETKQYERVGSEELRSEDLALSLPFPGRLAFGGLSVFGVCGLI